MAITRQPVTIDLDVEVAALLRRHADAGHVSEGEIIERALRALDMRSLLRTVRERSDLDDTAAMQLAVEEIRAARDERDADAA